jgi:hypothetical protein
MPTKLQERAGYWRIEQMFEQLGYVRRTFASSLNAIGYVGGREIAVACRDDDSKPDDPKWVEHPVIGGYLEMQVGIAFRPNFGKRVIKYAIALNSMDVYEFFVYQKGKFNHWKLLEHYPNLYADNIADVVKATYDKFAKEQMGGFIPLD